VIAGEGGVAVTPAAIAKSLAVWFLREGAAPRQKIESERKGVSHGGSRGDWVGVGRSAEWGLGRSGEEAERVRGKITKLGFIYI